MGRHQHYWADTGVPHDLVFLNGRFRYDCSICGKQKYLREQPVNPIMPSAWEIYESEVAKGNADLVMTPPIRTTKEDS